MFGKKKKTVSDFSALSESGKIADKKSVFDSDFIGKEGHLNPRTVKEAAVITFLACILGVVVYYNVFYTKNEAAKDAKEKGLPDIKVLENISFKSAWEPAEFRPAEFRSDKCKNPMLDLNKILAFRQKHSLMPQEEPKREETEKAEKKESKVVKKKVFVKGVLMNPEGKSMALINRKMINEDGTFEGYRLAKVTRKSVVLEDTNGHPIKIEVGRSREILTTQDSRN
ncbi:hypothetical protein L21SP3_00447 [Sedimentisphaera cyanobacteriorum]|uniref:Uncharacterized protein n=1 Tax=Sedimentisphaera cyanobacteriorum TaxID=1940790 RepID=A0A1Q2HMJ4_9BACT|nr:hypothetical protein [Sedimentisphaera cyanobacteriorum]AQQ08658.1 hypothetical protein L21SP3_00447 [Sedimentisphaera cyanobacteriorum]